jgi:hypothetical protein
VVVPVAKSCVADVASSVPLVTCLALTMSAEAATRVDEADDLTAYDVPASMEVADSPAAPGINGMLPAVADRIELLAVS